ncbi:MAG: DUF421 domain-containing protein [Tissierellia bacterium]|nr:DUF421 domain-containing protein [Tissierellia bacterium]
MTKNEILSAIHFQGFLYLEQVDAVVLETNGNISVLQKGGEGENTSLTKPLQKKKNSVKPNSH